MTNKTELLPCPFCGSSAIPSDDWAQCSNSACPAFHIKTRDFSAWNTRAPAEDVRAVGQEPVILRHMAVAENGVLRWMTGRKMQDCELYALPSGGAIRDKLYRHPQRPVVLPERYDESQYRGTSLLAVRRWNACIDEFERLNKC